jgi:hypothetical protein
MHQRGGDRVKTLPLCVRATMFALASAGLVCVGSIRLRGGIGVACFVGVVGYLGSALSSDGVVCVAGVFRGLFGLHIRVNVEYAATTWQAARWQVVARRPFFARNVVAPQRMKPLHQIGER